MNTQLLTKDLIKDRVIRRILGVFIFTIFTSLGAFVRIPLPFSPVPITLQTFFVLLAGLVLGGSLGVASQILYITLGASGLSIFTNAGSGLYYLLGPTGGYLFGFILVSFLIGNFSKKIKNNFILFFSIITASMTILICGGFWLMLLFKISFSKAFFLGILPFIPGDIIKSFLAYLIYQKIKPRIKEIF
ncbi:MAG: biotin transporter BioY [Candidatus Omnitrophica bacterium]|nr:biotin transporter BioY [Candidatus Omnitrophota bacterium]